MEILFITNDRSLKIPPLEKDRITLMPSNQFNIKSAENYSAIIIDQRIPETKNVLIEIRQSQSDIVALKPVFIFSRKEISDVEIQCLTDGRTNLQELSEILSGADKISKLMTTLKELKTENFQTLVILRILRFLYAREVQLKPLLSPKYRYGYVYPFAISQFKDIEDFRIYEILARMEKEGLLIGNFYDRVHFCNRCHSAFMNFREICPSCKSANLSVENVIHHFRCGYTAQESKFMQGEQLICPKCKSILRHIGTDYEKPSTIFICHSCQETFQEPLVECFCFYCTNRTPVEETVSWDIKTYEISPAGINCAINGIIFSFAEFLKTQLELVEYDNFKRMVEIEIERKKRYKKDSSIGSFRITNFQEMYLRVGERKNEIGLEMARIIKEALRTTDVITVLNESTFLILFLETPVSGANIALSRIKNNIESLLINNISTPDKKFLPEISIAAVKVEEFSLTNLLPE
ncbi:MAG: hypothetical protein NC830_03040 [Candidatus Omnitrophica bacterium]|nr:hypothetical protein [Candidatus Omnitrophota bacterium]